MRTLKLLSIIVIPALLSACKSTRPTVEIQERGYTPIAVTGATNPVTSSPVDDSPTTTLKVGASSLPTGAKEYTRISLTLAVEGSIAKEIENYALNDLVPLEPYKTYTLTMRFYTAGVLIYSNEFCKSSKDFKSKVGPNNYTVPLCVAPAEGDVEENLPTAAPTKTDATQKDSSSTDMQEMPAASPASSPRDSLSQNNSGYQRDQGS
ncbi:MAG: hypothetical protein H7318_11045 [Oligoflexus sp.]|nr:hypothetical protein [Oligoflexus sp.]